MSVKNVAIKFLNNLNDQKTINDLINDRIDAEIIELFQEYSNLIAIVADKDKFTDSQKIFCAMQIGYLLKGHLYRHEIEQSIKNNNY